MSIANTKKAVILAISFIINAVLIYSIFGLSWIYWVFVISSLAFVIPQFIASTCISCNRLIKCTVDENQCCICWEIDESEYCNNCKELSS